ncbi:MAG TPA: energy transducer TonB [Flavobacteriales bacterium]|nr:energy transducer TonB [Flavobacteriales bacterium]
MRMRPLLATLLFLTSFATLHAQEEVFDVVEQKAQFPGGNHALLGFLNQNLQYPEGAKADEAEGKVYVQFVVSSNGKIDPQSIKVYKSVHPLLDKEAIRLVSIMPAWKPAKNNGVPVASRYMLPITFKLL